MCNKSEALKILEEAYNKCKSIFSNNLHDVYLYGSFARNDYDDGSDIDILITVDLSPELLTNFRKVISIINNELSLEHDITVSIKAKPLEQFTKYSTILPYYKNILEEGIRYAG